MTAKEYLRQLKRADEQLKSLIEARNEMERARTFMKSPQFGGTRVQTSPSGDPPWFPDLEKWDKATAKIDAKWDKVCELKQEVVDKINGLQDARHIKLLRLRYVMYMSLDDIADEMGYTGDYIRKLHGRALDAFARRWGFK